jgi:mono/diheme cytochrome c family protein
MTTQATQMTAPRHSRIGQWVGLGVIAICVAVVGYIASQRPAEISLADAQNRKQVDLGQLTYQQNCMACHGVKLKGKPSWDVASAKQAGIPLSADGTTWHISDRHLFDAIATGQRVKAGETKKIHDTAFAKSQGGRLTDNEIWAMIAYFKTTWTARQIESQKETGLRERPAAPASK